MDQPESNNLAGVLPVFQMPFDERERIDFDTLGRELDWLLDAGSDGVVFAMVSEVLRLSDTERRKVAAFVCQHVGDRGAVVISTGAESTAQAEALSAHAQEAGADAVMVIPPVSVAVGEEELSRYYQRILDAVTLPVIVQDASGYVGRPMSIAMQAKLWHDAGPRVMFKPEATPLGPRLTALHDATNHQATIFEGTGGLALVESYHRGIAGTMPGADLIHTVIALWRALEADDEALVYRLWPPLAALVAMQHSLDAFLAIEKHLLVRQGVFRNTAVRGPVGYLMDDYTRVEVDRLFDLLKADVKGH